METLPEPRTARALLLLQEARHDVSVLSSRRLADAWSPELLLALRNCARRGLRVRILVDQGRSRSLHLAALCAAGATLRRRAPIPFPRIFRSPRLDGESWCFDGERALCSNRLPGAGAPPQLVCELPPGAARSAADYFELAWDAGEAEELFSVRHKDSACFSGPAAAREFFRWAAGARRELVLSLPGSRVSRALEMELHRLLREGVRVTLYAQADGDNTIALRRLRRLVRSGARLKICGSGIASELALRDGEALYLGELPATSFWRRPSLPGIFFQDPELNGSLLARLEGQVSVELGSG